MTERITTVESANSPSHRADPRAEPKLPRKDSVT